MEQSTFAGAVHWNWKGIAKEASDAKSIVGTELLDLGPIAKPAAMVKFARTNSIPNLGGFD